jgi:hypothetical protein
MRGTQRGMMTILRDVYCIECESTHEDVYLDGSDAVLYCCACNANTIHIPVCNGGMKHRARVNDFPEDHAWWRGRIKCNPPQVHHDRERTQPVKNIHTGEAMHDGPRYSEDSMSERRDRMHHKNDSKRGKTPLYFDSKRKAT